MRQFYFINDNGQRYQLQNGTNKTFLWEPGGLGFGYDNSYEESDGFFFEMNSSVSQIAKTGVLVFHGTDPYGEYKTLMDYLAHSTGLRLAYAPKTQWYYVDIDIESVDKTEIELDGTLQCSIVMMPKTPFYLPYEINIDLSGDLGTSIKQYNYDGVNGDSSPKVGTGKVGLMKLINGTGEYCYVYNYQYSNTAVAGEIEFTIPAQMDSGLEITIPGAISAPEMVFYANGTKIGEIDLSSISVQVGEYVRYSSVPLSAGIYLYSGGVESDITAQVGLNADYPTFFLLPSNKTIRAVLNATTLTGTSASLKVYEYFRSV